MKKCSNPDHPHCTLWVMQGDGACAGGHAQAAPAMAAAAPAAAGFERSSFELLSARRANPVRAGAPVPAWTAPTPEPLQSLQSLQPQLHISGFDPRAAGGRQALKMELRGMPADSPSRLSVTLRSALIGDGAARQTFARTLRGDWRPVFVEFSSRGKEHGQYQIAVELCSHEQLAPGAALTRKWACTMLILVPRADATLTEIHQIFLSTHKNVRVSADDGAIAKVKALAGGGRLDIDLSARNASIAQLDLDATPGKVNLGFSTIAWDEDLIEIDVPAHAAPHPYPRRAACLVNAAPEAGAQRQLRLFALDECVLGRLEQDEPEADVLLAHFGDDGQDRDGLTRRLSARHAIIRHGSNGAEIEDVSRYGLLLDGVWPGKNKPVPLRLGMRIELSASIKGIVVLSVTALLPNGAILHRIDQGEHAECFCFLQPERSLPFPLPAYPCAPRAAVLPLLFHRQGGFWHLDRASGEETPLTPAGALERLGQVAPHTRFAGDPYPEGLVARRGGIDTYQAALAARAVAPFALAGE